MILRVEDLTGEAKRVADLFAKYPETRDSYSALVMNYWLTYEWTILAERRFSKLTSPELITRLSRKLQNDLGMFQPSQDTQKKRHSSLFDYRMMEAVK